MRTSIRTLLLTILVAALLASAYWLGLKRAQTNDDAAATTPGKRLLYYRNPMGLPDTSPTPKKDPMGMDYIPVYEGEDAATAGPRDKGKILYYRNPMGEPDTSPVPKKDSMGMDYLPVYESDLTDGGQVRISADKVQKLGVKTATVERRALARSVFAVGRLEIDERTIAGVAPLFDGWIERLHVNATGQSVTQGQPLFEVYSPELYAAEQEYRLAVQGQAGLSNATPEARQAFATLPESSLKRLRLLGVSPAEIARLRKGGEARRTQTYRAPASGVVIEKMAVEGARFMAGETLFKLADLSRVSLLVDLAEIDLEAAQIGAPVQVTLDAYPGEIFTGKVDLVYPTLNTETRTAKLRVTLPNPGNRLKPGLYARAELRQSTSTALIVPDSAVIDTGRRQVALVVLADGLFQPREIRVGKRSGAHIVVLEGLSEGEKIVTSANFLIDAESNLKAALSAFGNGTSHSSMTESPSPAANADHPTAGGKTSTPDSHAGHTAADNAPSHEHGGH